MAYRPKLLTLDVEALGATWHWRTPDRTMVLMQQHVRRAGLTTIDTENVPDEIATLLPEMFVEGVVGWERVEDDEGRPLPCTEENRRAIPTGDKLAVAGAYLLALGELQAGKATSAGEPTPSTPPASASPADTATSPTTAPSDD